MARQLCLGQDKMANFLAIAESQVGYAESPRNFEWDEDGNKMGYSRYGAWNNVPLNIGFGSWTSEAFTTTRRRIHIPRAMLFFWM